MKRVENDVLVNGPVEVDEFGAGKHGHTDGDPAVNQDGTRLMAEHLNHIQEELCSAAELNGIVLDSADYNQVGELIARIGDAVYGDGSDGDLAVADSTLTTMNSDVYADDVTIGDNAELACAGFRLFVRGTLTIGNNSKVSMNGGDGVTGGGARYDPAGPYFFEGGTVGVTGTTGIGGAGAGGGSTHNAGSSGAGGAGLQPAGAAASSSAIPANAGKFRMLQDIIGMSSISSGGAIRSIGGAASGGAGGGDGVNLGGHSGAGGGIGFVAAKRISMEASSSIEANGGNGGDAPAGDCGGGGGGEGGTLGVVYRTIISGSVSLFTALGGSGGTGVGAGTDGSDGDDGTVVVLTH